MVPGVWVVGVVLKMSPVIFHKWKMQGLVNSPPFLLAVFVYSAYFFLILHLKTLSHRLMLLCHSPVGELGLTRKRWRKMRCRCGNCINIPLQCSCCWRAQTVTLTLLLCGVHLHQSVNLICLLVQPACPCGTSCSMRLRPHQLPSTGMTQSLMQHIWWGPQGTLEPKRDLDLLFSYVMSE